MDLTQRRAAQLLAAGAVAAPFAGHAAAGANVTVFEAAKIVAMEPSYP